MKVQGQVKTTGTNSVFHLPELSKRIVIRATDVSRSRFSTFSPGLGSSVLLVYRGDNILRGLDKDLRACVRSEVEAAGINIMTDCTVAKVKRDVDLFSPHLSSGSSIVAG